MSLVCPEDSKNFKNHYIFEGAVMVRRIYPTRTDFGQEYTVIYQKFAKKTTPKTHTLNG